MIQSRTRGIAMSGSLAICLTAAALAAIFTVPTARAQSAASQPIAITHVNVVPMNRDVVLEDMTVVVEGERIVALGRTSAVVPLGRGTQIIDGRGRYLLPGLTDMHVHLNRRQEWWLGAFLANGVTTVRNMNGNETHLQWREEIRNGKRLGPTIFTASQFVARDDVPAFYRVTTPEAARAAVRKFKSEGYDLIKTVTLDRDVFLALMDEAHKQGIPVSGHNPSIVLDILFGEDVQDLDLAQLLNLDEVLVAGMASIEHLGEMEAAAFARIPREEKLPQLARQVRESGTAITTLLFSDVWVKEMIASPDTFLSPERLKMVRLFWGEQGVELARTEVGERTKLEPRLRTLRPRNIPFALQTLKAFSAEGVLVLAGTDSGGRFNHAGFTLHDELAVLISAGLTPYEVLRTTTWNPAVVLGRIADAGSIEPGKIADLVLVEANPLENLATVRNPAAVMVRGTWLDRPALDKFLQAAPGNQRQP